MSNDWSLSWHHKVLGIEAIWNQSVTGKGVTVAVLDTGLAQPRGLDRPDFEYLDARGRRIASYDPDGHGTCCASLIASWRGGALGIAPEVKLVSYRVLETGNSEEDVETALTDILQNRNDIDIVSCSFTVRSPRPSLLSTVRALANSGKVVVAAAGNRANDVAAFPERTPNAITVAAVNQGLRPVGGGRVGSWIDLSAPGNDLPALAPGVGRAILFGESSAAAAVASGVAALALSTRKPGLDRRRLAMGLDGLLRASAKPLEGVDPQAVGTGLIAPAALIAIANSVPQ